MSRTQTNEAVARAIIDSNRYMTCATADANGLPWASPVWYAAADCREFFWVSSPEARHSRNIAARPQLGIVIFDSTVAPNSGQAVYMAAVAVELAGADLDHGLAIFNRRSLEQGLRAWTLDDVRAPARHRLYCATASEHFVLSPRDERVPVALA
jgi:pyridoxine/pyridoxamine 5'-phosphate oxidase